MVRKIIENTAEGRIEGTHTSCTSSIINLSLDIFGRNVTIGARVANREGTLPEIVPLARKLADRIVRQTTESLSEQGTPVTCVKGCSACCRYLVPLSVPDVFRITEELLDVSAECGSAILQSSIEAAKAIIGSRPEFGGSGECPSDEEGTSDFMEDVNEWYSGLELDCPLLRDRLCTIYDNRPLACREHIVTGSTDLCRSGEDYESQVVPLPVSILDCLAELVAELEGGEVESVMTPLLLPWAHNNSERGQRTWPAPMMVQRFFEMVRHKAAAAEETVYSR